MIRSRRASLAFGVLSALLVAVIGPLYAAPLLICALPVAFLTIPRIFFATTNRPDWGPMLIAFGVSWLVLLPVAPVVRPAGIENDGTVWAMWIGVGALPILVGALLGARIRERWPTS